MDELCTKQGQWLERLQSLSKRQLKVSKNVNGKPSKWVSLNNTELPVDYRTVLHNEVVIDIDAVKWKEVRMFAEIITDTLVKLGIPHTMAYSGGKGIHIHVFFDLSLDQKKICDKTDVMPKDLRMWLFHHIIESAGVSPKLIGPGKPFDISCVNWSDEGKGHLIRVFGGKKQKYKTCITEIPEEKPKDGLVFPDTVEVWHIPENLFEEFMNWFKKSQKERVEAIQRYEKASCNFKGMYMSLPCVEKILKGMKEGQRNAGARIISIGCRLDNMPEKEALKAMRIYAGNCSPDNISESEYSSWLDWIYSQDVYFWNCRFCKHLDVCNEEDCQFYNATFEREFELLNHDGLVDSILTILDKKIKKDRKNKLLAFLVCLSAYGTNPLNLFLKGESSIGKTHLAKSVAEYFPDEDVWFIGDMSPKALIHEHGRFENGKMYVSLKNKILIFLETPRKETLEMLKPILSHDRMEIEYKIADKRASGKLGTKSVIIEGWPSTIFCTTDYRFLEELSTRSMLTTPEVTEEKISEVLVYKASQYQRPWENREDEKERILKGAI
jgi:hypothetical protein